MKTEDFIALSDSHDFFHGSEHNDQHNSRNGPNDVASQPTGSVIKEDKLNIKKTGQEDDTEYEEGQCIPEENAEDNLVGGDSDMEIEDINNLPPLRNSCSGIAPNRSRYSDPGPRQAEEIKISSENLILKNNDGQYKDNHCFPDEIHDKDFVDNSTFSWKRAKLTESVIVEGEMNARVHTENDCLAVQDECVNEIHKMNDNSITGVKRARELIDEQQPSVHVTYKSLTRESKYKLEELLQQWSEWHSSHSSLSQDPNEGLESGEETFFPALRVGLGKISAVSFWMDNQASRQQNKGSVPLDSNSAPLYDRGCTIGLTSDGGSNNVEGGLEIVDAAARCFNCGSYSHSLKDCQRPRDNVAVNNARKQHKSKRKQNPGSRNPTRYYQNSPAGKYDGLRPGALDAETRKLLGLGELDPPPWLKRMREIGYPPGYLDPDDEDQPSGITIYADEEIKAHEHGELNENKSHEQQRKMTVDFPGINAPIPENADRRLWAAEPSSFDFSGDRSHLIMTHSSELVSRGYHRDHRWSRDYRDDGPPGVDPVFSPYSSSYPPSYGSHDSSYNPYSTRGNFYRRHLSDKDISSPGSFSYSPYSHIAHYSPRDYSSVRYENLR